MASKTRQPTTTTEYCDECGETQPIEVSISILTENPTGENAAFSREPYRIVECRACGAITKTRMNDV